MRGYCGYDIVAASYGSEQVWTCMVLPSTIIVTACAAVARSTSLGHLYMPQVRWSEYQDGFTGIISKGESAQIRGVGWILARVTAEGQNLRSALLRPAKWGLASRQTRGYGTCGQIGEHG